jgi:hypothetical protein
MFINREVHVFLLANVIDEPRPGDYYDLSSCNLVVQ